MKVLVKWIKKQNKKLEESIVILIVSWLDNATLTLKQAGCWHKHVEIWNHRYKCKDCGKFF